MRSFIGSMLPGLFIYICINSPMNMTKTVILILTVFYLQVSAQSDYDYEYGSKTVPYSISQTNNEVYAIDFARSRAAVLDFLISPGVKVMHQSEYNKSLNVELLLTPEAYQRYDSLVKTLGYSSSKKVDADESKTKLDELELELAFLREKRDSYSRLSEKLDPTSDSFLSIWNEMQKTSEKIFEQERQLLAIRSSTDSYSVSLTLNDELTSPENSGVSFVNMPGVEYSFLAVESPAAGTSADYYHGYFLKYLFTKGKSYGSIGLYKNESISKTDSVAYSELFILAFGQDFYSRHFGRGDRRFLNLYSGYQIGGMLASADTRSKYLAYLAPSIGIELFKNKYVLFDTKVSYFVPVTDSRNMRGISYSAAFNFVF